MSRESHPAFLEKSASRTLRRALARDSRKQLDKAEACRLRVQTVEPWKRILCLVLGAASLLASWLAQQAGADLWIVLLLGAVGVVCMFIGTFGRKKTIDSVLDSTANAIVSGILDGL